MYVGFAAGRSFCYYMCLLPKYGELPPPVIAEWIIAQPSMKPSLTYFYQLVL